MHAFLIIGDNAEIQIQSLLTLHNAKKLEATIKTIEEARNLLKQTALHFNEKTAIVLSEFSDVTPEAQNALLKLIEEPQENLVFILTSTAEEGILPTIFSRVELVRNKTDQKIIKSDENFFELSIGEKLTKTSKIKTREDALSFVQSLLNSAHGILLQQKISPECVSAIANAYSALKKNGNIQLQLTKMVTGLN